MNDIEYTIVEDNDAHTYVIPVTEREDWFAWIEYGSDDPRSWNTPDYAYPVDGYGVVFKEWRVG